MCKVVMQLTETVSHSANNPIFRRDLYRAFVVCNKNQFASVYACRRCTRKLKSGVDRDLSRAICSIQFVNIVVEWTASQVVREAFSTGEFDIETGFLVGVVVALLKLQSGSNCNYTGGCDCGNVG